MSWREREFAHESEAYYRSLDQAWADRTLVTEACLGGHAENGETIVDWFTIDYVDRKVRISFEYPKSHDYVLVFIEGVQEVYRLPASERATLIGRARELALNALKEQDESMNRGLGPLGPSTGPYRDRETLP